LLPLYKRGKPKQDLPFIKGRQRGFEMAAERFFLGAAPVASEEAMNDWCDQQDWVPDGDRIYRCTKCGKRLYPRERQENGEFLGWQLPPHKTKGHKIKAIKARQHRIRKVR
jgi:hypothetical protein